MPPGLVIIVAVLMALGMPRTRLRPSVPDAGRRARSLAWRPRIRQR
jgi:cytochrome c oxidase assembly factor CtaG